MVFLSDHDLNNGLKSGKDNQVTSIKSSLDHFKYKHNFYLHMKWSGYPNSLVFKRWSEQQTI